MMEEVGWGGCEMIVVCSVTEHRKEYTHSSLATAVCCRTQQKERDVFCAEGRNSQLWISGLAAR